MFDKLKELPGFVVNRNEELKKSTDMYFNLKNRDYFGYLQVVKNGDKGYGVRSDQNPIDVYNHSVQVQIGIFKKLETSQKELTANNYILEREILPLLDEKEFVEENPANFEARYLNSGLKKVRITFNKNYLPIRVDGYHENERGNYWEFLRHFSYPYKTKLAFNKRMNDYIGNIEAIERDKKAESEVEAGLDE